MAKRTAVLNFAAAAKNSIRVYPIFLSSIGGGVRDDDADIMLMYFETVLNRVKLRTSLLLNQKNIREYLLLCIGARRVIKEPSVPKRLLTAGIFKGIVWGFFCTFAGSILGLLAMMSQPSGIFKSIFEMFPYAGAAIGFVIGYIRGVKKRSAEQVAERRAYSDFQKYKDEFERVEAERIKNADRAIEAVKTEQGACPR